MSDPTNRVHVGKPYPTGSGEAALTLSLDELAKLVRPAREYAITATCPECRGTGKIDLLTSVRPCRACGGSGRTT